MSVQSDSGAPTLEQARQEPAANASTQVSPEAESFAKEVDKELASKLKEDPLHITPEDAARVQSVEHRALGHRPPHDSIAAQTQAMSDKIENFHKAADAVQKKLETDPSIITAEDAKHLLSAEHKVLGHLPAKDSISADVQRTAAANERSADGGVPVPRGRRQSTAASEQSQAAREKNFEMVAKEMKAKLDDHPEDITTDDAKHLRSVDVRAHGATEKGSLTAQVQSEAAKHADGAKDQHSTAEAAAAPKTTAADAEAGASIETVAKMETAAAGA